MYLLGGWTLTICEIFIPIWQAKNAAHRTQVQQATTKGIVVGDHREKQKFPTQFVEEALLLSDILDMNELTAVELLLHSEQQKANFPGLTRGMLMIML